MKPIAPRIACPPSRWRHGLAVAVGALALLSAAPRLAAQGDGVDAGLRQDMQAATVGDRLAHANRFRCPMTEPLTGLLLHDISAFDRTLRPAIERRFNLGYGLGVRGVIPDSAADHAGLRTGDVIVNVGVAVGERNVERFGLDWIGDRASAHRMQAFHDWLATLLRSGAQQVTIRRGATTLTVTLASEPGCTGSIQVNDAAPFDAWGDGRNIAINSGVLPWLKRTDELAFVLAHEMGHNWIEQAYRNRHRPDRQPWLLHIRNLPESDETKADLVAIAAMRQAGYDPGAALDLLARLAASQVPLPKGRRPQLLQRMARLKDPAIMDAAIMENVENPR